MRCRRCGAYIADGVLRCENCGTEIRIVPDYNPLDDVLTAQVKGSIDGSETPLEDMEYATRNLRTVKNVQRNTTRNNTAERKVQPNSSGNMQLTPEQRRRRAAKKKALKKKKRIRALLIAGFFAIFCLLFGLILYQFSYQAQVKKGYKNLTNKEYTKSEEYFKKAINKKPERGDAYKGISDLYVAQDEQEKAEELLLAAIDDYPESSEVYEAAFYFYILTENEGEIPILLDDADDKIIESLPDYQCSVPEFSLDSEETYDDVQQLSLESSESVIYYTTDGSNPFTSDTKIKYEEPIQISEGENTIKAVSVNKNNIPSLVVSKTYNVELPIEDAPAVSPSTGQYDDYTEIRITVPEGYTAYYTMDGTDPTEGSELYEGPIDMPSGSTIFKAVLVNKKGRLSNVTTRNYELTAE